MDAFYTKPSPFKSLHRIAELNRLQQNYPYKDLDLHQMVIAEAIGDYANELMNDEVEREGEGESNSKSKSLIPIPESSSNNVIVGFVDVDCRPCKTKPILPRPYISDLSVLTKCRRQGIAKSLVEYCERFIQETSLRNDVYIRVETDNEAAINMYVNNMDYQTISDEYCKISKATLYVLYKKFNNDEDEDVIGDENDDTSTNNDNGVESE